MSYYSWDYRDDMRYKGAKPPQGHRRLQKQMEKRTAEVKRQKNKESLRQMRQLKVGSYHML